MSCADSTPVPGAPTVVPHSARVLLAEDDSVFQLMLQRLLTKWGYVVRISGDGAEALAALQAEDPPRLAILDWMMPGMQGVEVCRRVRSLAREPYIYILLLTARANSDDLVAGMEAGADDYLTKPFNFHELRVRLRAGSRIVDLQEELLRAREALREQATHDSLTGIWNRASILRAAREELSRGARENRPVAVLLADLDHFKRVNDTFGHLAGDAVLAQAAQRMKASLRAYDAVGRYGGEEFLFLLPGCDPAGAYALAERIRDTLAREPFQACGRPLGVTCSIGLACRAGGSPADVDTLVREADEALYAAKKAGRNRVEAASPPPPGLDILAGAVAASPTSPIPTVPISR